MGSEMHLRPYQVECINAIRLAMQQGIHRQLVVLPTGSGKTVIFSHAVKEMASRALIIAHREELIFQAAEKLKSRGDGDRIGILLGTLKQIDKPYLVASIQSALRRIHLLKKMNFPLMVIDEAHRAMAPSYLTLVSELGFQGETYPLNPKLLLGFTATPFRGDGYSLMHLFEKVTYRLTLTELTRQGYLVPFEGWLVKLKVRSLDGVREWKGDYAERDLAKAVDNPQRNRKVAQETAKALLEGTCATRALVFCAGIGHALNMAEALCLAGVDARAVYGNMPKEKRIDALQGFGSGKFNAITNCMLLTEGYDQPKTDCIVMARPTKNYGLYVQMMGRGLRLSPGKKRCLVLDFAEGADSLTLAYDKTLARKRRAYGSKEKSPKATATQATINVEIKDVKSFGPQELGEVPVPDQATRKQLEFLRSLRIEVEDNITKQEATNLIEAAVQDKKPVYASDKQLGFLRKYSIPHDENTLKSEATDLIEKKIQGWTIRKASS